MTFVLEFEETIKTYKIKSIEIDIDNNKNFQELWSIIRKKREYLSHKIDPYTLFYVF